MTIKRIKHKLSFCAVLFTALLSLSIGCAVFIQSDDNNLLKPKPTYTVVNHWYDEDGRKVALNELECTRQTALHLDFETAPQPDSMLIIQAQHLGIKAYTSGKILYKSAPTVGQQYYLIPLEGVGENGTVYLHLTPYEHLTGSVCGTVKLSTQNDWLMSLLQGKRRYIYLLSAIALGIFILCISLFFRHEKKQYRLLYLLALLLLLLAHIFAKSGLLQCFIGSALTVHTVCYAAYMLLPIPLTAFFLPYLKRSGNGLLVLQGVTCLYTLLRLLLLLGFTVPLDRWLGLSHCLLAAAIISVTYSLLQQCRQRFFTADGHGGD